MNENFIIAQIIRLITGRFFIDLEGFGRCLFGQNQFCQAQIRSRRQAVPDRWCSRIADLFF
jgi:hypothetical protein